MALNGIGLSRSNWDHGGHGLLAAGPGTGEEQMETSPELEIAFQSRNGCDKTESSNPLPSERARRKVPSTISVPTASRKALEHDKASVSQSNLFGEDYKTRVPKKRWCARCRNFLSVYSWIFLSLAFVQSEWAGEAGVRARYFDAPPWFWPYVNSDMGTRGPHISSDMRRCVG